MQKSTEKILRKIPFPLDIEVTEGTSISDGIQTLTYKETSHIKLLRVDTEGFLVYEVTPPKKVVGKPSLTDFPVEEQLIETEKTGSMPQGQPLGIYKYYRRSDGTYHAVITGKKIDQSHGIELGKITDKDSPLGIAVRTIAYQFDTKKFSRQEIMDKVPKVLSYTQKMKSILGILHKEGFLVKEIDQAPKKGKAKELYSATDKLKRLVLPSPSPEQT